MLNSAELSRLIEDLCVGQLPAGTPFGERTGFFEAGLDSKALSAIMIGLKEQGVPVTLIDFFKYTSVAALAAELGERDA